MEELKKIRRVIAKLDDSAPHEVLLVIDAGTGQNAMNQMQEFSDAVAVTGLVLTKLDGTAKGGMIFSLYKRFGVPVRFVGLGENLEDLQPFDARNYVEAVLSSDNKNA
jgi:fused signal recognition particle receptor